MPGKNYFSFIHKRMQTIFMLPGLMPGRAGRRQARRMPRKALQGQGKPGGGKMPGPCRKAVPGCGRGPQWRPQARASIPEALPPRSWIMPGGRPEVWRKAGARLDAGGSQESQARPEALPMPARSSMI